MISWRSRGEYEGGGAIAEHRTSGVEPEDDTAWQRYLDTREKVQARMIADHLETGYRLEHAPRTAREAAHGAPKHAFMRSIDLGHRA
jgi:hypothetical protein